ncbi:MAG: hypothetical protein GX428_01290 [Candidatus Atribacteria bacterium]|nr:hypothetical protein [Candidatus Atribacteria bacterium]
MIRCSSYFTTPDKDEIQDSTCHGMSLHESGAIKAEGGEGVNEKRIKG